ncbi:type II toxin-antitoxin system RelE/ParE family toxin [Patescibacteria group bacterium]|nr:type II toxin-antitoxin system RelE/ParE family toxin [Patescibacteria group bacterium]
MKIKFFSEELEKFIVSLEKPAIARVLRTLDLLERFGNELGMPHSKKICPYLFELRVRGKQEIRIIYCFHKNVIILLHAFIKKSQKIPLSELKLARRRLKSIANI